MEDGNIPLVLDNGSGMFKAGFAGEDIPRVIFPTVISSDRIGYEALANQNSSLFHPIQQGIITDWNQMESIWQHTFHNELNVTTEDRPVLLTETVLNLKSNRDKMIELMFECFNIPSLYIAIQPVLSLYASGRTTGIVYDSGHSTSYVVPIFEGNAVPYGIQSADVSGVDVTDHLEQLITKQGISLAGQDLCNVKEKLCYIPQDYKLELTAATSKNYELPDGNIITLKNETLTAPEILFTPSIIGRDTPGIPELINTSIQACNRDIHKSMYNNIILSSGNTMFPGIAKRVAKEMSSITPPRVKAKLTVPAERKYSVWIGGSILASMSSFQQMWLSKLEYEEGSYVRRKCF